MKTNNGKVRPVAKRGEVNKLTKYDAKHDQSVLNQYHVKSEPDLLDSKYVEYRRPWYVNPDYNGPRNIQNFATHSNSLCNVKTKQSENMGKKSDNFFVFTQCEEQPLGDDDCQSDSKILSNCTSDQIFCAPDLSDNLSNMDSHLENYQDKITSYNSHPSSSSESAFSMHTSSRPFVNQNDIALSNPNSISRLSINSRKNFANLMKRESHIKKSRPNIYCSRCSAHSHSELFPKISYWSTVSDNRIKKERLVYYQKSNVASSETDFKLLVPKSHQIHIMESCQTSGSDMQYFQEALFHVFSYLDSKSLARSGAVCRLWYQVSRRPELWQRMRIKNTKISSLNITLLSRWTTQVVELSLQNITAVNDLKSIKVKQHSFSEIERSFEKLIQINQNTLRTLRIVDCDEVITSNILWTVSIYGTVLNKLIFLSKKTPLGQEDIYPLGKGCQKLTSLIIAPGWPCKNNKFTDLCCEAIAKCWPKLEVLCIGGQAITSTGLIHISKGCLKLQKLEIDHGPEITEDVANKMVACGLRGLSRLDFTFTPISPRAVVLFNSACPRLEHIGIHCSISNYFPDHSSTKSKASFNSLKTLFKKLKLRPNFLKVLDLNLDYEPES